MILAKKTMYEDRINLVDTKLQDTNEKHYVKQMSKQEAILLLQSLLGILLPQKKEAIKK